MNICGWSLEHSMVATDLKRFIAEKCAQVRAETRAPDHPMSPESTVFFTAAERCDWSRLFDAIAAMHRAMREGSSQRAQSAVYPVEWAVVNEIGAALEAFAGGDEEFAIAFARDIIKSIPAGSIYFGGTDAGRFLVTALSSSHKNGDPFFTITQNALADHRSYLRYLRQMYGDRIYVPTEADANQAISEYEADARKRRTEGKLLPGEMFEEVEGKLEIHGHLSVIAINDLLTRLMFDRNSGREFYIEESFPLGWMYPHLLPHGPILKINRQPLSTMPDETRLRDREFWSRYTSPLLGDWLTVDTALPEILAFVQKVYLQQDMSSFRGNLRYIQNDASQTSFSKLRLSIGGVYAWRAQNTQSEDEKHLLLREAEFAFRQAFVLDPNNPEAVFRFVNLLLGQKRIDDAISLVSTSVALEEKPRPAPKKPSHIQEDFSHKPIVPSQSNPSRMVTQLSNLLEQLRRMNQREN